MTILRNTIKPTFRGQTYLQVARDGTSPKPAKEFDSPNARSEEYTENKRQNNERRE